MVTDLGSGPGGGYASRINDAGQVVGVFYGATGLGSAFLYDGNHLTDLGSLVSSYASSMGGLPSYASAAVSINGSGQVVGYYQVNLSIGLIPNTFLYSGGKITSLTPLSSVNGINDAGQIIGYSFGHAVLYDGGKMTNLGTFGGGYSSAAAINSSGQVVGLSYINLTGDTHAFLYSGGKMTDLGTLPGFSRSQANDINASGQIVGTASTSQGVNGPSRAFLDSGGKLTDLGTLSGAGDSHANGINSLGQVVGGSGSHAFLFSNGKMTDLNSLIAASSGWQLIDATAINNKGHIVGQALDVYGSAHVVLLTPMDAPEPASLTLLAVGAVGLSLSAWRRRRRGQNA
jgi:probable HAF family extracellular repeat protein